MNPHDGALNCRGDVEPGVIRFHQPHLAPEQMNNVGACLSAGHLRAGGKFCRNAKQKLSKLVGCEQIYLTQSCTAAMEIMALALELGPEDEVIAPSYTFCATATAFARTGARIVLCDVEPGSMMLDPERLSALITPRTRAAVVVHYGGYIARMEAIKAVCDDAGVVMVEDAAQGLGASQSGRGAGTFGAMGALSFHETKIAHCGQGGALLVNPAHGYLVEKIEQIIARGTNFATFRAGKVPYYEWTGPGGSFELTDLQAAVLDAQLQDIETILSRRRAIYRRYENILVDCAGIKRIAGSSRDVSNGHFYAVLLETEQQAHGMIAMAGAQGIELQQHYKPLHLSEMADSAQVVDGGCPVARAQWQRLVRLPVHTAMSDADVERVASCVSGYLM